MDQIQKSQILNEYQNGISISKISLKYNIPYKKIQKVLKDNNITIRGGRKKKELLTEVFNQFAEDFKNGVSYRVLSEKYNLDSDTLKRIAEENKLERKNNNRVNKNIKSDYFSNIDSKEKAYWLGFLFTDGSVDKQENKKGRIRFQLQAKDKEILEKYKECLGLSCELYFDNRRNGCYSVEFTDDQIFFDLGKYGIVPNKTYKTKHINFSLIPKEFQKSFLLGLFDGDGSLSYSNDMSTDVTIHFTSYFETTVQDFQFKIDELINKEKHNKNFYTNAWHTQWRGRKQVLQILDMLYEDCPLHLKRKYDKYLILKKGIEYDIV